MFIVLLFSCTYQTNTKTDINQAKKLCELKVDFEIKLHVQKQVKQLKFVFNNLDDLKLIKTFIRKFLLNAKFIHPMFDDQNDSIVPMTRLDDDIVQSNKSANQITENEETSALKKSLF